MKEIFHNKRGNIVGYILIYPTLVFLFIFLISAGSFFIQKYMIYNVTSQHLDLALVEGQFTTDIKNSMREKSIGVGLKDEHLVINYSPDNTLVNRQEIMTIELIHNEPHALYHIARFFLGSNARPESFYIKSTMSGMSEKWHSP